MTPNAKKNFAKKLPDEKAAIAFLNACHFVGVQEMPMKRRVESASPYSDVLYIKQTPLHRNNFFLAKCFRHILHQNSIF